eukprot:7342538-Prymnesium_polylepis.1
MDVCLEAFVAGWASSMDVCLEALSTDVCRRVEVGSVHLGSVRLGSVHRICNELVSVRRPLSVRLTSLLPESVRRPLSVVLTMTSVRRPLSPAVRRPLSVRLGSFVPEVPLPSLPTAMLSSIASTSAPR